jgi:hypothetical protein
MGILKGVLLFKEAYINAEIAGKAGVRVNYSLQILPFPPTNV